MTFPGSLRTSLRFALWLSSLLALGNCDASTPTAKGAVDAALSPCANDAVQHLEVDERQKVTGRADAAYNVVAEGGVGYEKKAEGHVEIIFSDVGNKNACQVLAGLHKCAMQHHAGETAQRLEKLLDKKCPAEPARGQFDEAEGVPPSARPATSAP